MKVKAKNLLLGDTLVNTTTFVDAVYNDIDGLWLSWSDGDEGYVLPNQVFNIDRYEED